MFKIFHIISRFIPKTPPPAQFSAGPAALRITGPDLPGYKPIREIIR